MHTSDEQHRCFRCLALAPLNADSLCIQCGEPGDGEQDFTWTCPRCGAQHRSDTTLCPCGMGD